MKLAIVFTIFFPGIPHVYYGEEVGLSGTLNNGTRQAMPWDNNSWDNELRYFYKECINLRKNNTVFYYSDFSFVEHNGPEDIIVYKRQSEKDTALIVVNKSSKQETISIKDNINKNLRILISSNNRMNKQTIDIKKLEIGPYGYYVISSE